MPPPRLRYVGLGTTIPARLVALVAVVAAISPQGREGPRVKQPLCGASEAAISVVVSRQATDDLGWLRFLGEVSVSLWTESADRRTLLHPSGRNHSRWRPKPLTRFGGTTRECGGFLAWIIACYEEFPQVAVFLHGEQAPHFTYAHPHSDPHIFRSIRSMLRVPSKVDYCSLNFYYTDWRNASVYWSAPFGWQALVDDRLSKGPSATATSGVKAVLRSGLADVLEGGSAITRWPYRVSARGTRCYGSAQFAVSRQRILAHPLTVYQELLAFIVEDPGRNPWDDRNDAAVFAPWKNGRCAMMESVWHVLFGEHAVCDRDRVSCRALYEGTDVGQFVVDRAG